jgi:hypothetical protein
MHLGDQRQKSVYSLFAQSLNDDSFVAGASVNGIPVLDTGGNVWRHIRKLPRLVAGTHSFALSVTNVTSTPSNGLKKERPEKTMGNPNSRATGGNS